MKVILEDDLVDSCKSGKNVIFWFETGSICVAQTGPELVESSGPPTQVAGVVVHPAKMNVLACILIRKSHFIYLFCGTGA
jgi:hypothetical protein